MLEVKNIRVDTGKTSMRLEGAYWELLQEICRREGTTLSQTIAKVDRERGTDCVGQTRTEAVRVFVLRYFAEAATEEGHRAAGHGDWHLPSAGLAA